MKVISIINNKGGCGKTATTGILSQLLAAKGKKVLAVDLDQQCNLSMMLGCFSRDSDDVINGITAPAVPNIAELFRYRYRTEEDVKKIIVHSPIENLDMIPASKRHKNTQLVISMNETGNNNSILRKALQTIKDEYDYILIDNGPANDILTVNAMFASDSILIPVKMEGFSYEGLMETLKTIQYIKDEHDLDSVDLAGAFITQAETNTNICTHLTENYAANLNNKFLSPIRKDIRVAELETNFLPVMDYCPTTNAVMDYKQLMEELRL